MSPEPAFVILGCGYTGQRVVAELRRRQARVVATSRDPRKRSSLRQLGVEALPFDALEAGAIEELPGRLPANAVVLYSVPTLRREEKLFEPAGSIAATLAGRARRVVYLSTTGVYGAARQVDHLTPPQPETERQRLRLKAERALSDGPWESLVLRPAAIYGPGRGVQEAVRERRFRLAGDGGNYVSRIHVDDLAAIATAALLSSLEGAYPVADDHPCPSREIAEFCAELLGVASPAPAAAAELSETRRSDRRVNGGEILRLLGVRLRYPSYRQGIPAALERSA